MTTKTERCSFVEPDLKKSAKTVKPPDGKEWKDVPAEDRCNFTACLDTENLLRSAAITQAYKDAHDKERGV